MSLKVPMFVYESFLGLSPVCFELLTYNFKKRIPADSAPRLCLMHDMDAILEFDGTYRTHLQSVCLSRHVVFLMLYGSSIFSIN